MNNIVFEVNNLVKKYHPASPPANDDISLTIRKGEVFGMLGPNGAGKSTLVRQMASLTRPTSGEILLYGQNLIQNPQLASQYIAVQPQGFSMPVQARVKEILKITGIVRGLSAHESLHETNALIEQFGLNKQAGKRLTDLSGGQKRLVSIAATIIGNRPILILDEPTNDLDPEVRRIVWEVIRNTAKSGSTIVLVTHNVVEAEQALDRLAIIKDGKILASGTPGELKSSVEGNVRIEMVFHADKNYSSILDNMASVIYCGNHRYNLIVPKEKTSAAIEQLIPHLSLLEDFRIVTTNLEDVYIELMGGAVNAVEIAGA